MQFSLEKSATVIIISTTHRTLSYGVEYLEKKGDYRQANDILKLLLSQPHYGSSYRGHWFERLALNLDYHLGERSQVQYWAVLAICHCQHIIHIQCLDVIRSAMEESTLHPAKRLSLLQRAHKLYHTTSNSKVYYLAEWHNTLSTTFVIQNKRAVRREGSILQSSISDFPQLDIIPAPEVFIILCITSLPLYTCYRSQLRHSSITLTVGLSMLYQVWSVQGRTILLVWKV